ncbi:Gfo/Idh/MocA family oxidoreductase [Arthrobacter sp. KBS0702]|uniref:Gfo/Idh/MocA family protein n=1 Tax=Arthrobacter sp. KBS0702 TaxID=2578107 RepID=UPI00110F3B8B|nr:Gfo/Idh/MocA family oxidoreductase [Arthrobacter sp. KBS0702]QDW30636.1 Gfo/Idh/MocA family oxidoreductase [Arthrobacter sp. KBS0702]
MRIALIGAGFIAASHAAAARAAGVEIAGVTDNYAAASARFAATWGVASIPSVDDVLADDTIDAVVVCTPNDTHFELALAVAAAGKSLLLEKPMALSAEDAGNVVRAFERSGKVLLVGHTHRHADYAQRIRDVVHSGAIGEVRALRIAITGGWIWGGWSSWVLDPARSGGHAFHNGVHLYDLAAWWLGSPITSVYAVGQPLSSAALQIDDYLCATLVTSTGATAVCEISRGERPRGTSMFELVVHGDRGTLVRSNGAEGWVAYTTGASGPRAAATNDPFLKQMRVFAAAVAGGAPSEPSPHDAVRATVIAEAVEASARTGRTVRIAS